MNLLWSSPTSPQMGKVCALTTQGRVLTLHDGTPKLLSGTIGPVITPLEPAPLPGSQTIVDASESADVQCVMRLEVVGTARVPTVRRYGSQTWVYPFQFQVSQTPTGMHVSKDGQTIVAWVFTWIRKPCINDPAGDFATDIAVFSAGSPNPQRIISLDVSGTPTVSALSADGRYLLIAGNIKRVLLRTDTGQVVEEVSNTRSLAGGAAVSNAGMYFLGTVTTSGYWESCAQYSDAGALTVGRNDSDGSGWSVTNVAGATSTTGRIVDLGISGDGQTLAVLTDKDLRVYQRGVAQTPFPITGMTADLDLAADGSRVAVVTRLNAGAGEVSLFQISAAQTNPTHYTATIPFPAVQGAVHTAIAQPVGSGAPIQVRVL